jgi:prepilin-type N-terminal cleavage/methylation domain-containing protein
MLTSQTTNSYFVRPADDACVGRRTTRACAPAISVRPHPAAKRASGFSLIELLAVVVLISLIASATGGMAYGTYRRMLVEKAAKKVYLAAKYARLLAVERQMHCRLMLDAESRSFCLTLGAADLTSEEAAVKLISDAYSRPTQFGGQVEFEQIKVISSLQAETDSEDESKSIVFYPDGTADTAALQIGDGKNHYAVYVLAATGKAQVRLGATDEMPVEIVDLDMDDN